jgi:hypothetical protein
MGLNNYTEQRNDIHIGCELKHKNYQAFIERAVILGWYLLGFLDYLLVTTFLPFFVEVVVEVNFFADAGFRRSGNVAFLVEISEQ